LLWRHYCSSLIKYFHLHNHPDTSIDIPCAQSIRKQKQKRLKSAREAAGDAAKKRVDKNLQKSGLSQMIMSNDEAIVVNGKVGAFKHCQFCNDNHNYTYCDKRCELTGRSRETLLRNTNPDQEDLLRERIMSTMPFSNGPAGGDANRVFQSLPQDSTKPIL
jgi:hypothetical protein